MTKAVKLNDHYALQETTHGEKIFAYIEHEGELYIDPFVGGVMLDEDALVDMWRICCDGLCPVCRMGINLGETVCDDCYADARRYREDVE